MTLLLQLSVICASMICRAKTVFWAYFRECSLFGNMIFVTRVTVIRTGISMDNMSELRITLVTFCIILFKIVSFLD